MPHFRLRTLIGSLSLFAIGFAAALMTTQAQNPAPVYEMRVYTAPAGKLGDLQARFRNHTTKLFEKHGMKNVGYWTPTEGPQAGNTLIYILQYPSREAATASWQAFRTDPEWQKVKSESEKNGPLTTKVESTFMAATDYSALR